MLRRSLIVGLALAAFSFAAPCRAQDTWKEEAGRLADLLNWQPGSVVADVGAGRGELTELAAQKVGPSGKVYTTELDTDLLAHLQELAEKEKTIVAVKAAEADTSLPEACCDSIFMRLVYHHLAKPAEIDAACVPETRGTVGGCGQGPAARIIGTAGRPEEPGRTRGAAEDLDKRTHRGRL